MNFWSSFFKDATAHSSKPQTDFLPNTFFL